MTKSFTLKFFSSHREQKSQTFIIIILNKISILLCLHCQPKEKHSLLVFCPRIRATLEDLRGNMTDVGLESGVQKKSSQPQWNNAEQSQRRGSLQVAYIPFSLGMLVMLNQKLLETLVWHHRLQPIHLPLQILNYLGDSLWLDCVMLCKASFIYNMAQK